jgi:hypothetical protein
MGYVELYSERSADGRSLDMAFGDSSGGVVEVSVSPATPENRGRSFLTDAGMEWTSGSSHISVSGTQSGELHGKTLLRSLGAAIDPSFSRACMIESVVANDERELKRLGFSPPVAPPGFTKRESFIELTRPTKTCRGGASGQDQVIDFMWTLAGESGETIRAGIYRYGQGSEAAAIGPRSLHWSDDKGTRFWVAVDAPEVTPSLEEQLYRVAESMDPAFGH